VLIEGKLGESGAMLEASKLKLLVRLEEQRVVHSMN
jgi:hypothetical protein